MADTISLQNVWPEWQVEKTLGKGSYGTVYKAVRKDHNIESYSAIKVISIPNDSSELSSLRSEGFDENSTRAYFQNIVDDFVGEIQIMQSLKGNTNIVSVEDYKVVENDDSIGWTIYIRMELLTPFNDYAAGKKLSEAEVVKLGCDICTALEICGKKDIIHRDIKPENIFVNEAGDFKLGDFGIARKMENMSGGMSQKGTFNFMAPEVVNSPNYDARVDICSLGIVLYKLLNNNHFPFLETEEQCLNVNERRHAVERRLQGEKLPVPSEASPAIAQAILCACAHDPNHRFATATAMKKVLLNSAKAAGIITDIGQPIVITPTAPQDELNKTVRVREAKPASVQVAEKQPKPVQQYDEDDEKKKSKLPIIIAIIVIVVTLLIGAGVFLFLNGFIGGDEGGNSDGSGITSSDSDDEDGDDEQSEAEKAEIESILAEAATHAGNKNYQAAIDNVNEGLSKYPDSADLKQKKDEYTDLLNQQIEQEKKDEQQIAAILEDAKKYADQGYYDDALEIVEEGLVKYPNSVSLEEKQTEYSKKYQDQITEEVLAEAKALSEKGDHKGAMTKIKNAQIAHGDNRDYKNAYREYEALYIAAVIAEADKLLASSKYDEAEALLTEAKSSVTDSTKIDEKISSIEAMKPTKLDKVYLVDSFNYEYVNSAVTDSFGNIYAGAHYFSVDDYISEGEAVFNLNKGYTQFTGSIVASSSTDREQTVNIYVDDELVYTTKTTKTTGKIDFKVNVTNKTLLKIKTDRYPNVAIVDAYLTK